MQGRQEEKKHPKQTVTNQGTLKLQRQMHEPPISSQHCLQHGCSCSLTCACWISSLYHEVLNDPVELDAIVITSTTQFSKVAACHGCMLPVQLQHKRAHPATSEKKIIIIIAFKGAIRDF